MAKHLRLVNFRAKDDDIERWKEDAYRNRMSLSRWIRHCLDREVPFTQIPLATKTYERAPVQEKVASLAIELREKAKKTGAKEKCERKLPKGAFCKTCGRIHG